MSSQDIGKRNRKINEKWLSYWGYFSTMSKSPVFLFLFISVTTFAQETFRGIPHIRNFNKSEYHAGTQNWGIIQDQRGFLYFANNDGLLSYNGGEWGLTRISSSAPLRSIMTDSENRIYVGLINDFGVISRKDNTASSYSSLKDLLPEEDREFDDIWRIHELDGEIVFQCHKYIFIYKEGGFRVIKPDTRFHFSFKVGNQVFVQEMGVGMHELSHDKLVKLDWWQEHRDQEICSILEYGDEKLLVGTTYNGIYILENGKVHQWEAPVNELLVRYRLYSALKLPNNLYAFGTILNGLIISDSDGNVLYTLNTQ